MSEIDRQRIKSIYSQIKGYLDSLPKTEAGYAAPVGIVQNYNSLLGQLSSESRTSFESHKIPNDRNTFNTFGYDINATRMSMAAVVNRLKDDYGFDVEKSSPTPLVVTVNQNQQMSVTVVSLQSLIEEQDDEEIKALLDELKDATERKDSAASTGILKTLADRSWEVFIRALPYILEHWGR